MDEWGPGLAIILGIVEGLTEFLPVSSTGHLILVGHFLGFTGDVATSIDISIQLGAILAILAYERRKIAGLLSAGFHEQISFRKLLQDTQATNGSLTIKQWRTILATSMHTHRSLWFLVGLGVAFCPAAAVGLLAHSWIKANLFSPYTVAGALIVGGVVIILVEQFRFTAHTLELKQVGVRTALMVGIAQCLALFPGVSRSGATIIGGLMSGMHRTVATEYSFFLALPTMLAATSYQMFKARNLFTQEDVAALILGLFVAFFVAWAVIAALLAFVKQHTLQAFGYYRIVLGLAVLFVFR